MQTTSLIKRIGQEILNTASEIASETECSFFDENDMESGIDMLHDLLEELETAMQNNR